ncbi:tyrosine-type recombinase/integrase [Vibrio furnissii]|uniref:tyrosine-type recombinase/integrase n=1 Tax=Vibrio furnissii TaxID=29494 RepID=UPI001EEA29A1|nr:site-specific integrase [Vibrio furnissii]MCG6261442.1 site-specific integrase [Vibrio furnissii]
MKNNNYNKYQLDQFGYYLDQYLISKQYTHAPSTLNSNRSRCNQLKKNIGKIRIASISHSDINLLLNKMHKKLSNKTINEYLTILRDSFNIAKLNGVIAINPTDGIKKLKTIRSEVFPFTKSELSIMAQTETTRESERNLILFNAVTGLRASEIIASTWSNVDWEKKRLKVDIANVNKKMKVTKTLESDRFVELSEIAIAILKKQYEITGHNKEETIDVIQCDNKSLKRVKCQFIFVNSLTQKRFIDIKQFQSSFFTAFLKNLDISHRGPSQLRHTYASQCLTSGISKEWIAKQLGHTSTEMVTRHYGRWIPEDSPDYTSCSDRHMEDIFTNVNLQRPVATISKATNDDKALFDKLANKP